MVYLEYEKTRLPVLDGYNITKSSQEIAYSDFKCDFTGRTPDELPQKYEEVKVVEERELNTIIQEPIKKTIENSKDITFKTNVDSEIEITKIKGNHYQDSRDGYNLLDFKETNTAITTSGLNYKKNSDGSIEVSGTTNRAWDYTMTNKYTFKAGKTYTVMANITGKATPTFYFKFNSANGGVKNVANGSKTTITIKEDQELNLMLSLSANFTVNFKAYILLYEGTEDKPYEQYGASPSLDYPSEIETVGSNVNMYDEEKATQKAALIGRDGTIVSSNLTKVSDYIEITNDYYTVNYTNDSNTRGYSFFDKNKIFVSGEDGKKAPYTVARPQNAKYIRFSAPINANDIKLELGLIATPYSPFGMGGVEIDVVNKNLLNIANIEETTKGGIIYSIKNGILKLNGTATASFDIQLSKNIKIKKGKYTHSSSYIQSGLYISFDNIVYTLISTQNGKKRTFEITEDTTYKRYFIWIDKGTVLNNIEIKLQLEVGSTATDFVEHQSQSVIMPIQQEMLSGDYISDKEYHNWNKYVFTGEENISKSGVEVSNSYWINQNSIPDLLNAELLNDNTRGTIVPNFLSTHFKTLAPVDVVYHNNIGITLCANNLNLKDVTIRFGFGNDSNINTADKCKTWLKSQYDAGTPVIIYYKLATPVDLALTEEQKNLNKLQAQKGINYITAGTNISVKYTEDMIPKKAKRIKQNLLCYGYVDNYAFPELREQNSDIDISFTLLSPSKMSTLRTCTAVGTYKLKDLLKKIILKPLLDDGFVLIELNVTDISVTVNFLCKTVDYCLNCLSNKFNIWCNIDEQKNIYIKDIELIWNEGKIKHVYDDEHSIKGLQYIKPSTSSDDYANVINFTNVRIYESSSLEFSDDDTKIMTQSFNPLISKQISNIKKGDQILFEIPIDTKKENILKSVYSRGENDGNVAALRFGGIYTDNTIFNAAISYDKENDVVVLSDNLGFENGEGKDKEFLLVRDSFFSNLVTGIKYNGSKTLKAIEYMNSDSALMWSINKFYNNKAINEQKNKISKTGIIETTLDMKESWKTVQELREIGTTYMNKNGLKLGGQVELKTDEDVFKVGDTIKINKMIVSGVYVVTDIQIDCSNNDLEYIVTCKNANMLSSFIDIFRSEDTQETSDKTYHLYLTYYNQEEFAESHEVIQE